LSLWGWKEAAKLIEDGIAKTIQQEEGDVRFGEIDDGGRGTKLGDERVCGGAIIENMVGLAAGR